MSVQILPGQNAVTCDTEDASRHEDESDVDLILSIFREFIAFRGKKNIPRYYRGDDTRLHLRISGFDSREEHRPSFGGGGCGGKAGCEVQ